MTETLFSMFIVYCLMLVVYAIYAAIKSFSPEPDPSVSVEEFEAMMEEMDK